MSNINFTDIKQLLKNHLDSSMNYIFNLDISMDEYNDDKLYFLIEDKFYDRIENLDLDHIKEEIIFFIKNNDKYKKMMIENCPKDIAMSFISTFDSIKENKLRELKIEKNNKKLSIQKEELKTSSVEQRKALKDVYGINL